LPVNILLLIMNMMLLLSVLAVLVFVPLSVLLKQV
jgi:hypothetical protein